VRNFSRGAIFDIINHVKTQQLLETRPHC